LHQEESVGEEFGGIKRCYKWTTLDILSFEGEDTVGWIGKVERYFRLKRVQEEEKMEAVMVAMEGIAYLDFSGGKRAIQTNIGFFS